MPVNTAGPSNDIESGDIAAGAVTIPKLSFDPGTQAELDAAIAAYVAAVEAHRADTTVVHGIADTAAVVLTADARLADSRPPNGPAGGVLSGTFPDPAFAVDMATQAELNAETAIRVATAEARGVAGDGVGLWSIPGITPSIQSTQGRSADYVYYEPFVVEKESITVDRMKIEVTSAATAGKVARVGIVAAGTTWQPAASLILDGGLTTEFAIDALGEKDVVVANLVLPPGRYLAMITANGNATYRSFLGDPLGGLLFASSGLKFAGELAVARTYAALAASPAAWAVVGAGATPFKHTVFLRRSA